MEPILFQPCLKKQIQRKKVCVVLKLIAHEKIFCNSQPKSGNPLKCVGQFFLPLLALIVIAYRERTCWKQTNKSKESMVEGRHFMLKHTRKLKLNTSNMNFLNHTEIELLLVAQTFLFLTISPSFFQFFWFFSLWLFLI